jgi:outer membrane protein OmpA-like peptidoglycan-associated protein
MNISRKRLGPFGGPILIAGAIMMAGAGAAQAACKDDIAEFNRAVDARQTDAAISGFDDISASPAKECLGRLAEFRARLVDLLIEVARTQSVPPDVRDKALDRAEKIVEASGYWQGKEKIGDYYLAQRTQEAKVHAHEWYKKAVTTMAMAGAAPATDQQKTELTTRLAAAQSLANDDKGGTKTTPFRDSSDLDGRLGGIYSRALRVVGVNVKPVPINFVYDSTEFTENGRQAMTELAKAVQEAQQITLVGHTDQKGSQEYNMDLSKRRAIAVRDKLVSAGIPASKIKVEWKGKSEPFDVSVLPDPGALSDADIQQLDRRVVLKDLQ